MYNTFNATAYGEFDVAQWPTPSAAPLYELYRESDLGSGGVGRGSGGGAGGGGLLSRSESITANHLNHLLHGGVGGLGPLTAVGVPGLVGGAGGGTLRGGGL